MQQGKPRVAYVRSQRQCCGLSEDRHRLVGGASTAEKALLFHRKDVFESLNKNQSYRELNIMNNISKNI